jgi:hypothetical protein
MIRKTIYKYGRKPLYLRKVSVRAVTTTGSAYNGNARPMKAK